MRSFNVVPLLTLMIFFAILTVSTCLFSLRARRPDGKTVTGHWAQGHLSGRCFFQWPDGATYDGDTEGGKKSGRGYV